MKTPGKIQVYTGNGKGKTTAAIGLSIRAAGRGWKIYIAQFMKQGDYGEIIFLKKYLSKFITIEQFGLPGFHSSSAGVTPEERQAALIGVAAIQNALLGRKYDLIILDEINVLLHFKIIETATILELLAQKPPDVEMVLTGRYAPPEILKLADLITEMKEVKHYYQQGLSAREGIEK